MKDTGVTAYSLHPGVIKSDLGRYMAPEFEGESLAEKILGALFGTVWMSSNMDVATGALTQLYAATAPTDELVNGGFYWPVGVLANATHPQAGNVTLQKYLWTETEQAINVALKEEKKRRDGVVA